MAKALSVVKSDSNPMADMRKRIDRAMSSAEWQLGIIRARRQFADDDRKAALQSAAMGYEHEALSLHAAADQHETEMTNACTRLGRIKAAR